MSALTLTNTMPYWMPALLLWAIYRRVRSSFGVQPWRPILAWTRVFFLVLIAGLLLTVTALKPETAWPVAIGTTAGLVLGAFALRHAHVGWQDGIRTFTPNPWISSVVGALLLGRIVWRATHGGFAAAQQAPSGLTFGLAMALIGYWLVFTVGLIVQMARLPPAPPAEAETPPAG